MLFSTLPVKAISGEFSLSFSFEIFESLLSDMGFTRFLYNSMVVSVFSVFLTLALSVPPAYTSVRWKARKAFIGFIAATRCIPQFTLMISLYLAYVRVGLQDTYLGLILVYTFLNIPLAFLIMRRYFELFDSDLEEAALCDGSSRAHAFFTIVLPLVKEGLLVATVVCFVMSWNELPFALILTDVRAVTATKSLLYLLYSSRGVAVEQLEDIQFLGAAAILQLIPTVLLVGIIQRLFTRLFS
jgi:ABC-type glycerol-3-phosphate transport system permease component